MAQKLAKQKLSRTRLERSRPEAWALNPRATADLKTLSKPFLDLCEFNTSTKNLIELTGPPQMNQNSEFITCLLPLRKCLWFETWFWACGWKIVDDLAYIVAELDNVYGWSMIKNRIYVFGWAVLLVVLMAKGGFVERERDDRFFWRFWEMECGSC